MTARRDRRKRCRHDSDSDYISDSEEEEGMLKRPCIKRIKNDIYFYETITDRTIFELQTLIHTWLETKRKSRSKHLTLHLMTRGGTTFCGFAMYDLFRSLRDVKITVIVEGECASAGSFLLLGADIRKMRRHSYLLLHHISQSISGNFVELDQALRNIRLANDLMMAIYKKKSNLTEEQILKLLNDNIELSASKAFEYGLIDEII